MSWFSNMASKVGAAVEDVMDGDDDGNPELHAFFEEVGADTIIEGIKEALSVAIKRAVELVGKQDGFLMNQLIKIKTPSKLKPLAEGLRAVGMDDTVDEFERSLNRAAEKSAPLAADVFVDTIRQMKVKDAESIWRGDDPQAATKYIKERCSAGLTKAFKPVVDEAMQATAATRNYAEFEEKARPLPFIGKLLDGFDIETYTVEMALKGLFLVMAEEEEKIRKDPSKRVGELMQKVFSRQACLE